jgi:hypothetical protein
LSHTQRITNFTISKHKFEQFLKTKIKNRMQTGEETVVQEEQAVDTAAPEATVKSETKLPNFSKLGTKAIQTKIDDGTYQGEVLEKAKAVVTDRAKGPKAEEKKTPVKKTPPAKKTKAEKQAGLKKGAKAPAAAAKKAGGKKKESGISHFLRGLMRPKDLTANPLLVAVTYGEANKAVKKKFPERIKLYASEFDRNFELLKKEEGLAKLKKQPPQFKTGKEEKKPAVKKEEKVKE